MWVGFWGHSLALHIAGRLGGRRMWLKQSPGQRCSGWDLHDAVHALTLMGTVVFLKLELRDEADAEAEKPASAGYSLHSALSLDLVHHLIFF